MDLITIPQALYPMNNIRKILMHEESCILYKELDENLIDRDKLVTSHSVVYVINGKLRVNTYDGEEIVIHSGEMLFMPRDSYLISDYLRNDKKMQVMLFFFNHDLALKFLGNKFKSINDEPNGKSTKTVCQLQVTKNIKCYLESIRNMHFEQPHDPLMLELKLLELLYLLEDGDNDAFMQVLRASEYQKKSRDIESLMLEHFDKNLSIRDFASLSGRSISSFNRDFKLKHGSTPKQWLITKKMHRAKQRLHEGCNVSSCSMEAGYNNVSNFIKAYKTIHGTTPKQMQKHL